MDTRFIVDKVNRWSYFVFRIVCFVMFGNHVIYFWCWNFVEQNIAFHFTKWKIKHKYVFIKCAKIQIFLFNYSQCPPTVFYIPSFLSKQEEDSILAHVDNTPKPKWTQLSNRRLINYGGVPHPNGMIAEELPDWLKSKVAAVNNIGQYVFGKCILNDLKFQFGWNSFSISMMAEAFHSFGDFKTPVIDHPSIKFQCMVSSST